MRAMRKLLGLVCANLGCDRSPFAAGWRMRRRCRNNKTHIDNSIGDHILFVISKQVPCSKYRRAQTW